MEQHERKKARREVKEAKRQKKELESELSEKKKELYIENSIPDLLEVSKLLLLQSSGLLR